MVPGASITGIEEKITSEFARFAREGPTAAEMESIRNQLESGRLSDLESVSSIAYTIQQVHQIYGGIDHWSDWVSRYSSITAEDVRAAVNRWLVAPSHVTIDVRPQTAARPDTPQPDRATPPSFQPDKPYRPPEIQTAKLVRLIRSPRPTPKPCVVPQVAGHRNLNEGRFVVVSHQCPRGNCN